MRRRLTVATVAALSAACADAPPPTDVAPEHEPVIRGFAVAAGPHNVLSAVVRIDVKDADSVAAVVRVSGTPEESATPFVPVAGATAVVPVLGLRPATRYDVRVVARGRTAATTSADSSFTTDSLPADLPSFTAGGPDPTPGYVLLALNGGRYAIVIDNAGRVVWYRSFASGMGLNFQAQPNGRYVVRPPTPLPGDIEPWLELDPLGNVTRAMVCAGGLPARPHDMIAHPDGTYWLLCDETRTMDLSALGGVANARVTGTVVQHLGPDGSLRFQWNPFDHFAITDLEAAQRTGASVNWTHGNAIAFAPDSTIIVSFRNLGEITRIDPATGAVRWRLGGLRNQFTLDGTTAPAFASQHGARVCSSGALLLLDNLGDPAQSRAERYLVDESAGRARLERSYATAQPVVTQIGGSVQELPGGRALVSYGTAGRVEEYDANGAVTWQIAGNAGYVFRAQRIASLYHPGAVAP